MPHSIDRAVALSVTENQAWIALYYTGSETKVLSPYVLLK